MGRHLHTLRGHYGLAEPADTLANERHTAMALAYHTPKAA
jgi:hypothetical protein